MKKAILAVLVAATALAPIAASAQEWNGRSGRRGGDASAGQSRGDRGNGGGWQRQSDGNRGQFNRAPAQRPAQVQAPQAAPAQPQQYQRQRPAQARNLQPNNGAARTVAPQWRGNDGNRPATRQWQGNANPGNTVRQQAPRQWQGNTNPGYRNNGTVTRQRQNNRADWNRNANRNGQWNRGNSGWNDNRGNANRYGNWNRGWRGDNRYNWQDWRSRNRSLYRLPRYYAPSGWGYGYQRFGIGMSLSALLFAPNYWIDDPWSYRLPDVYGPYRWVRYYNDALLVDIDTGEVVDVIYDIFW